jgi:hypothetical protein
MHRIRTLARLGRQLVDIDDDDHDVVVFGGAELFEVVEETVEEIELALGAADERRIRGIGIVVDRLLRPEVFADEQAVARRRRAKGGAR